MESQSNQHSVGKRVYVTCFAGTSLDVCSTCNYHFYMSKMIQLRHVPDALHRQLKARAAMSGMPLSDYLIREVRKIAEQPTLDEMRERLQGRGRYRGKRVLADLLLAERDGR
jgi:antitoxin FitA